MPSSYQPSLAGMPFSKIHPPYISERPPKRNCAQGLSAWHRLDVPPFITHLGRHARSGHAILSAPFHDGRPLNGFHINSLIGITHSSLIRSCRPASFHSRPCRQQVGGASLFENRGCPRRTIPVVRFGEIPISRPACGPPRAAGSCAGAWRGA